jgi:hypothetical protein
MEKEEFKNFDFNFIANFDIEKLSKKVLTLPKEHFDGTKDNYFLWTSSYQIAEVGFGHLSTIIRQAIVNKKPLSPKIVSKDQELWDLVKPIARYLESINPGKIHGSIALSNLLPQTSIPEHRDYSDNSVSVDFLKYSKETKRYHIVLTTNEKTSFTNGNTKKFMKVGECWEINKSNLHSVRNDGLTDRIHLVIDILPKTL